MWEHTMLVVKQNATSQAKTFQLEAKVYRRCAACKEPNPSWAECPQCGVFNVNYQPCRGCGFSNIMPNKFWDDCPACGMRGKEPDNRLLGYWHRSRLRMAYHVIRKWHKQRKVAAK